MNDKDALYDLAVKAVIEKQRASISFIQREFMIGFNRAYRIVKQMELEGVIGKSDYINPRKVLRKATP